LPYLLPRALAVGNDGKLIMILAFGDLSYLEACTVLGDRLSEPRHLWDDVALVGLKGGRGGYEGLAGVHKVAVAITPKPRARLDDSEELKDFLGGLEDGSNFSVSAYSPDGTGEAEYEELLSTLLSAAREAGLRKANLVRPRSGTEVLTREIASRKIVDLVVLRMEDGKLMLGATSYIPDAQQFQTRSNERPVVSSQISISSRLARLLLNLSGVKRGEVVLDPFCGSGTILSEAMTAGVGCIGVDRDRNRIENSRQNLEWLAKTLKPAAPQPYTLKVGDSTRLETVMKDVKVDAVVTEPILLPRIDAAPALEKAKKMIRNSSRLYSESLYSMSAVVRPGGRIVLVVPSLRTAAGRDVSVLLENVQEAGLVPFRPACGRFEYPVRISRENTRWVHRLVYVFERA